MAKEKHDDAAQDKKLIARMMKRKGGRNGGRK